MPGSVRRCPWRRIIVTAAFAALAWSAAAAKDTTASIKEAEQYIAQGNLKAAEIQLRNAIREAPQDPVLRARLAEVYLREGDPQSAEREARAARERQGNEADYLPVLADALLRQAARIAWLSAARLQPPSGRQGAVAAKCAGLCFTTSGNATRYGSEA